MCIRDRTGAGYGQANQRRRIGWQHAQRGGASALVVRSVGSDSHRFPHTGMMSKNGDKWAEIPVIAISNPDADNLRRLYRTDKPLALSLHSESKWNGEVKEGQLRGGSHTDYGSITLLWRFDDVGGLQVENRRTGEWEDVPIVENSIVLNVADLFSRWSNGILKSTNHRVVNTDMTRSRYSMPYFVDAGRDVMIENFTNQPDKFEPISAYEYLKWRLAQSYNDDTYIENKDIKENVKKS